MKPFNRTFFDGSEQLAGQNEVWSLVSTCSACHDVRCKRPMTAVDGQNAMAGCAGDEFSGVDGLLYEVYCHMPGILGVL